MPTASAGHGTHPRRFQEPNDLQVDTQAIIYSHRVRLYDGILLQPSSLLQSSYSEQRLSKIHSKEACQSHLYLVDRYPFFQVVALLIQAKAPPQGAGRRRLNFAAESKPPGATTALEFAASSAGAEDLPAFRGRVQPEGPVQFAGLAVPSTLATTVPIARAFAPNFYALILPTWLISSSGLFEVKYTALRAISMPTPLVSQCDMGVLNWDHGTPVRLHGSPNYLHRLQTNHHKPPSVLDRFRGFHGP